MDFAAQYPGLDFINLGTRYSPFPPVAQWDKERINLIPELNLLYAGLNKFVEILRAKLSFLVFYSAHRGSIEKRKTSVCAPIPDGSNGVRIFIHPTLTRQSL